MLIIVFLCISMCIQSATSIRWGRLLWSQQSATCTSTCIQTKEKCQLRLWQCCYNILHNSKQISPVFSTHNWITVSGTHSHCTTNAILVCYTWSITNYKRKLHMPIHCRCILHKFRHTSVAILGCV